MRRLVPAAPLLLVAVIANFLHFRSFGLYDDDWYYMAPAWDTAPSAWLRDMLVTMRSFYAGRPLQEACLRLCALAGAVLRSVPALYIIAAALYVTAVVLMYRVLRMRYPVFFATLAALLFAISPLTSIRQHLDATLWSAPAFICLFLAILSYRRPAVSYLMGFAALLIYEPMYFVFLAAPFFRRGRKTPTEWIRHALVWGALLAASLIVRRQLSEARMVTVLGETTSQTAWQTIWHTLQFAGFYTLSTGLSYGYAAYVALRERPAEGILWTLLLALPVMLWVFRSRPAAWSRKRLPVRWWIWKVLLPGLVFTALGYALSYFSIEGVLVYPITGRDTRFSLAAEFGSSIFAAGLLCCALAWARRPWVRSAVTAGGAACYLLFFLYSFVIQDDYIRQWKLHRKILAAIVDLSPDVTPDTLFVLQRPPIRPLLVSGLRSPSISNRSHGLQVALRQLFEHGHGPEILEVSDEDWKSSRPGPFIVMTEKSPGVVERVGTPLPRPDSAWTHFTRSPLTPFVLPNLR